MDDGLDQDKPKVQADNNSIAIGEINISGNVTGNITIGHIIVQAADARLRYELGILLKNVETTWIKGVLEKSVHEAALLELGMELREEAVDNPWRMVIEKPDQSRETLPPGRRIKDIFNEANRLLLILGEPGSGKTTTLLQLARDLIAEVDEAFTQPVPVILNLSTWTNKQQPLDEWLVAELNSKYRLPKRDGQKWLQERRILPLLDGLDEVKLENRATCVEKINQLVNDYGLQGLVVCSRVKDYTDLNVRLAFYRAIYLQLLTPEQVNDYLKQAGNNLASLLTTLQSDEALRSMAQSPLILNIMCLTYQNTPAGDLSDPNLVTNEDRRKYLFDTYISRMYNRKLGEKKYEMEQTKQWLSWLARNMQRHNQDLLLIDGLQPSWLPAGNLRYKYLVASRMVIGMIIGLAGGLILAPFLDSLVVFFGLGMGLLLGGITGRSPQPDETGRRRQPDLKKDIKTIDAVKWSWRQAAQGLFLGLLIGPILGVILAIRVLGIDGWFVGVILGLLIGLPIATFSSGLKSEIIETKRKPNEGIHLSIKNAIIGSLIFGIGGGLTFGWFFGETPIGLSSGLGFGLIGGLLYGATAFIRHYILRYIFINQDYISKNPAHFLDFAVEQIFLQKVGGGYRFIHRLLLEHFAYMDKFNKSKAELIIREIVPQGNMVVIAAELVFGDVDRNIHSFICIEEGGKWAMHDWKIPTEQEFEKSIRLILMSHIEGSNVLGKEFTLVSEQ